MCFPDRSLAYELFGIDYVAEKAQKGTKALK